jgi:hypothetical protein
MIHTLLPAQLQRAEARAAEPQRRLMIAVLRTAVDDYRTAAAGRRPTRVHQQAIEWVSSTDRSWAFSFENVCEAVGLDPQALRRSLDRG